ncbi:response regulator receiver protein [Halarcobacter mediterraneus]|uniref:Response regulator receiver protein n=1 Tax=Halarcobacter mediterraneus TaxID=2023153 RepID=A0A4Q1B6X4_9BACT|nr:response regulator transcription factor [Halarcobacter mediterraneus]RXK14369.1 response regulator receiver protein [Halarcobacter mediterraneus]
MNQEILQNIIKSTKNLHLLYIEDNEDVREQTLKMLQIFFDNISIAKDGEQGLEEFKKNNKFESTSFDLIITDIEMPNKDGISMINSIREYNAEIPILIFSAHSNTDYFLKSINAGIDGYILKPYNIEQISNSLMNIIEKNRLLPSNEHIIHLADGYIWNNQEQILYKDEKAIKLTKNETKLFILFIKSKGALKTYDEIDTFIFSDFSETNKRVRNLVSRLKSKLEYDLFESIYGHGYKLKYKKFI